ncbi:MAG: hypothetical protein ACLVK4_16915 [Alistipes shahii]|uniref:hypothetical protein n=1 Tax=Alistipes shahii TaxID=328814 RepID=UPI00399C7582
MRTRLVLSESVPSTLALKTTAANAWRNVSGTLPPSFVRSRAGAPAARGRGDPPRRRERHIGDAA